MNLYPKQKILLRENLKVAQVIKKLPDDERWLVSFYDDNNKFTHRIITKFDIIEEDQYNKIKERNNKINQILGE